jgi:hypothetical protein
MSLSSAWYLNPQTLGSIRKHESNPALFKLIDLGCFSLLFFPQDLKDCVGMAIVIAIYYVRS